MNKYQVKASSVRATGLIIVIFHKNRQCRILSSMSLYDAL